MLVAKSALIITVADDFYDMVDSLSELEGLTDAKEKDQGKINSVLVNMVEDLESSIEDSIALVTEMIHKKEKELLEHALIEGHNDLPKASNHLHLSCLKVFHMFFNCSNRYDSETAMLQDISKAIYLALSKNSKPFEVVPLQLEPKEKTPTPVSYSNSYFKHHKRTTFTAHQVSQPALRKGHAMVPLTHKVVLGFL
ncbi:hypothetical protein JHK87_041564 [Glycine soja]|nr:hypothetical protein JHK87_041564 [Glycine soja]